MRIGVLADTHGLLRPSVLERLAGVDRILHAGDVGGPEILAALGAVAPVEAVRGNTDTGELARLPKTIAGDLAGLAFRLIHREEDVDPDWTRNLALLVFGHSHRPELAWRNGCLCLNPGACGPRRFKLPLTIAVLTLIEGRIVPEILAVE